MKFFLFPGLFVFFIISCSNSDNERPLPPPPPPIPIDTVKDIPYGVNQTWNGETDTLKLDIYSPKDASSSKKYPLLVLVHGGTFLTGKKENLSSLCSGFAQAGYIAVSIDYRLGWNDGTTECGGDTLSLMEAFYRSIQDFNASMRFLVSKANELNIDTSWIFIGGSSAGAVATINSVFLTNGYVAARSPQTFIKLGGLDDATNHIQASYKVKGVCNMWGALIDSSFIKPSNGLPVISFHGAKDGTIPVEKGNYLNCPNYPRLYGSEFIYNTLSNYHYPSVVHILPNGGHGVYDDAFIISNSACFFKSLMNNNPQSGYYKGTQGNCP